jgi:integrase
MRGDGRVFQRHRCSCPKSEDCGCAWWIAYCNHGKEVREAGGRTEKKARQKLRKRLGEVGAGTFIGPEEERLTVGALLDALSTHLKTKGARGNSHGSAIKAARLHFGEERALSLNAARIERWQAEEMKAQEPKAAATINRVVGTVKQAYNLARKQGRLARVPYFPMLREDNARQGFFEHVDFEAVAAALPVDYADAARFGYLTGWRKGEILPLRWDAVDRTAGEIRLRTSKNGHGRVIPLEGELVDLIGRRWQAREYIDKSAVTHVSALVFHRKGELLGDFRKAWASACKKAGCSGRLFHDLRRTAVRNVVRAGVPQSVAMSISGHRTISMFLRYNITSDADQREAFRRVERHLAERPKIPNLVTLR